MFVDASREFISGTNQNALAQRHIDKIVASYVAREAAYKYAHRSKRAEIEENDFNMNRTLAYQRQALQKRFRLHSHVTIWRTIVWRSLQRFSKLRATHSHCDSRLECQPWLRQR